MNSIKTVFISILKEIVPTKEEIDITRNITMKLRDLLSNTARKKEIYYTTIKAQGSTGIKQTQLRGDYDIDLFIGLDYNHYKLKYKGLSKNKLKSKSKKDFLDLCKEWIIKSLTPQEFKNPRLLYAEHPYVTIDYITDHLKVKVDIVLYFDLELQFIQQYGPVTAVDRSPWHGKFIKDKLSLKQKNDVRLLKQFFKANYSYGDKSAIGKMGFFGYCAELLIYYYKSLVKVFNKFNSLVTNPLDYYKRSAKELNKITHFQNDYLLIIDPIDKNRNVASAISEQAYRYCNYKIQQFLKRPNKQLFQIKPIPQEDISKKDDPILSKIYVIELKNGNQQIHYTINRDKLYSIGQTIKTQGEREFSNEERFGKIEFEVYFEDEINEYNIAIYSEKSTLTKSYLRKGPPSSSTYHAKRFKKKNPNFIEKSNYLWTETIRDYTEFLPFIEDIIRERLPENFKIVNISLCINAHTISGKRAIYILKNCILPF